MPHIVVKYSKELDDGEIDLPELVRSLHTDLISRETVGHSDTKAYALPISCCEVGDDGMPNVMIHIILKLLPGRSVKLKKEMVSGLKAVALSYVSDISVTVEIQELEAETYSK